MSNLNHIIRKFNRFELKYLVPIKKAEAFKEDLKAYLSPDEHGDSCGSYNLSSLYFDGPDFRFYWEKIDGIKFRRKLRIRLYETQEQLTEATPVFVEIKQRLNRVTQKRRIILTYSDALQLCSQRLIPAHVPQDAPVIDEAANMVWQYNLRPVSTVRYTRLALIGTDYDIGLRVTFDKDMQCSAVTAGSVDLERHDTGRSVHMFPPDWIIIEIKVNERIPYWLTELVAVHGLNLMRVSKYCRSIETTQNMPSPIQHSACLTDGAELHF